MASIIWVLPVLSDHVSVADAEQRGTVSMFADVGFSGYFGKSDWVPVTLTIHNTGQARSGDLIVQLHQGLSGNKIASGKLDWPVSLPAHAWKSTQIYVPGFAVDSGTTVSCFIAGHAAATTYLNGNAVGNVAIVAVLSTETQSAQFLTGSSDGSEPVLPVSVNPQHFPASANLLNALTAVVTTPETLGSLTAGQQLALLTWVKLGGLLLVTGTEAAPSFWEQYFPIVYGPEKQVPADGLQSFAGSSIPEQEPIVSYAEDIRANATLWANSGSTPLLASLPVGRGTVWQTSFSPLERSLLGWSGNPALWTNVLRQGTYQSQSALVPLLDEHGVLSFAQASDALSPLRVPSLRIWAIVLGLYVLLVGPVIFFILRRYNRTAWAWVVLPVISCATTLGIYVFGLMIRPLGLLNEGIGVLELTGDGTAETYGIQAFMSPYRGGLNFQLDQPMLAMPLSEQGVLPAGTATVTYGTKTQISFTNVSRWNVRYLYAAGTVAGQGELQVQLASSFGMLFGTVKNNTAYPLHNAALFWHGHMYELGDMGPGQSIPVNQMTGSYSKMDNWASIYGAYNHDLTRGIGRTLGAFAAATDGTSSLDSDTVMFAATTSAKTPCLPSVTTQDVASSESVVLVRQFAPVTVYSGGPFS